MKSHTTRMQCGRERKQSLHVHKITYENYLIAAVRSMSRCTSDMITFTNQKWSMECTLNAVLSHCLAWSTLIRMVIHPSNKQQQFQTIHQWNSIEFVFFDFCFFVVFSFILTHHLDSFSLFTAKYQTQCQWICWKHSILVGNMCKTKTKQFINSDMYRVVCAV